jgi:hypothetical protein
MRGQRRKEELTGHIYKYNFRVCLRVMTEMTMLETHGSLFRRGGNTSGRLEEERVDNRKLGKERRPGEKGGQGDPDGLV